jgi:hypothetical protein
MGSRHDRWWVLLLPVLVFGLASAGAARVLRVPGQYATIGAAVEAAADSDTILVDAGVYEQRLTIEKFLTLTSEDGPENTIIDGGGASWYPAVWFRDGLIGHGDTWVIDGFTVQNGHDGIAANGLGDQLVVRNCIVRENSSSGISPADCPATIEGCTIVHNAGDGVSLYHDPRPVPTVIVGSFIAFNDTGVGGATDGGVVIEHNTIVGNTWDGIILIRFDPVGVLEISSNIIVSNGRSGIDVHPGLSVFDCSDIHHNDVWGSGQEDVHSQSACAEQILGFNGNISEDPLFCDIAGEDFTLSAVSPCVGTGAGGTNMGAFGVGCEPESSAPEWQPRSWGTIKALYR